MSAFFVDNFVNVCRACMSNDDADANSMESIFEVLSLGDEIASIQALLMSVVPELTKIEADDDLPKMICKSCLKKLLECSSFQRMCLHSDSQLRRRSQNFDPLSGISTGDNILEEITVKPKSPQFFECVHNESMSPAYENDTSGHDDEVDHRNESSPNTRRADKASTAAPTEKILITCKQCPKAYKNQRSLKNHIAKCHSEILAQASASDKKETITKEQGTNFDAGLRFDCDECNRTFTKLSYLRKHKTVHARGLKRQRTCSCGLSFKNFVLLSQHQLSHIQEDDQHQVDPSEHSQLDLIKPCICEICKKAFKFPWTLRDHHVRVHTKQQAFLCSECGKSFNTSSNLQQHILRHGNEKRYECPECPKKFPCLSDLASHKKSHKKTRPYVCDLCSAAFGRPYHLKKHKMHHSGTKNYKCEQCEKRFVTGDHMRRHMRTHTGEKPYQCQYCGKAFMQSNDLMKHLRLHLGENVYRCDLCPRRFPFASTLREHLTEHKNEDAATQERNRLALIEEDRRLRVQIEQKKSEILGQC